MAWHSSYPPYIQKYIKGEDVDCNCHPLEKGHERAYRSTEKGRQVQVKLGRAYL